MLQRSTNEGSSAAPAGSPALVEDSLATKECGSQLLLNRLAARIVDESLPLKEVERELRSLVADVAVRQRGLPKRELASRCGVTEKSVENYLKETRVNPKSPDREIARLLQDDALSLEEVHEKVFPVLSQERNFTLNDTKRSLENLLRSGEVVEQPGRRYRANAKAAIRCPLTPEAYRGLVAQKARDLDYIVLRQQEVAADDLADEKPQRFSRVVGDTNLVRVDFTVDVPEDKLGEFYEKLSAQVAKLTMKFEKKQAKTRVRLLLGMRRVLGLFLVACLALFAPGGLPAVGDEESWELDKQPENPTADEDESWELDFDEGDARPGDDRFGAGADHSPKLDLPPLFVRGDANSNRVIQISDAITLLRHLYLAGSLDCEDAADANDSGFLDLADAMELLHHLYVAPASGSVPIGGAPSADPTDDDPLGCESGLEAEDEG